MVMDIDPYLSAKERLKYVGNLYQREVPICLTFKKSCVNKVQI